MVNFIDVGQATRDDLSCVTRGVYVMQSEHVEQLYRFGLIGGGGRGNEAPTDMNNAFSRLGQCRQTWRLVEVGNEGIPGARARFRYVFLVHTPLAGTRQQIKAFEGALRSAIRNRYPDRYRNDLIVRRWRDNLKELAKPRDAFVTLDGPEQVSQLATAAIAQHCQR
jgi:hypothetical protein